MFALQFSVTTILPTFCAPPVTNGPPTVIRRFPYSLMSDPFASLTQLLAEVILPNLKAVQASQSEQIAANERLELAIEDLRTHLDSQFAMLSAQLTACQAELAATQAALKAAQLMAGLRAPENKLRIN